MCGLGYYLIGFKHEGHKYTYIETEEQQGYKNLTTGVIVPRVLYPCSELEWISERRYNKMKEGD